MNLEQALLRIQELENGIRLHRDERGTNRCWLDDNRLYSLLAGESEAVTVLPEKHLFIKNCERFYDSRQNPNETGGCHAWNDAETKAEAELIKLKDKLNAAEKLVQAVKELFGPTKDKTGDEWDNLDDALTNYHSSGKGKI